MTNLSKIFNSGSLYEQLISQVIAVESQPRLKLRAEQSDQNIFKGVLSDYSSRVSSLNTVLERFTDTLQSPFGALAATVGEDARFTATASDEAASGRHEVQVTQIARADARLSKQFTSSATTLGSFFVDPGDPGDPGGPLGIPPPTPPTPDTIGARSFTIHIAQDEADDVALDVSYTPEEGATDDDILAGIAAAINAAVAAADLEEGTGASASIVHETDGTSRLTLRSSATGYNNRLTFTDTDGLLAQLEVNQTAVRSGTGGGAVYAVGTGVEDSALSAAFTLDGLQLYRDSNTVEDALDGVTLTLNGVDDEARTLTIGADTKAMKKEVESFIKSYNALLTFINDKSAIDAEAGTRGVFAADTSVRSLRNGLRADLSLETAGAGALSFLSDLGITAGRDGKLSIEDADALENALAKTPGDVGALFAGENGIATRFLARIDGLLGSTGTIEARKDSADARIRRLDNQIERWDARLTRREEALRAQFTRLQEFLQQAESQQASIQSLFFF